jgi:Protein of unknown function (DUF2917)
MKFDLDQSTIQLTKGNLISLPDAEGSTVAVLWGSVWLTQDGDSRDYEVNAGESFTIRGNGLILISAFENTALTVLQPCDDVTESPMTPSENVGRAKSHGKTSDGNSVRYLSGDELERYKRDAHELRAIYAASLIFSLGSALSRGLSKLGDYAVALRLKNARWQWTEPRHRLYW